MTRTFLPGSGSTGERPGPMLTMTRCAAVTILLLVCGADLVQAQAPLRPGARIRIERTGDAEPVIGSLVDVSADTLILRPAEGAPLLIPARTIRRLDISTGIGHAGGRGAILGAALGVVPGIVWGLVAHQQCEAQSECFFRSPAPEIAFGAAMGAGAGALIGYLIGTTSRREHWQTSPVVLSLNPSRLELSVAF